KLWVFRRWDLYKCNNASIKGEPLFQVRKIFRVPKEDVSYQVTLLSEKAQASCYMLENSTGELAFKIADSMGELVAEARQKHSFSGVGLGHDVLTLMVESHVDHSIVMALVTVPYSSLGDSGTVYTVPESLNLEYSAFKTQILRSEFPSLLLTVKLEDDGAVAATTKPKY
ncbi:hypothetical protein SO802_033919, partial [Lithocarpus litseifolius]